MPDSTTFGHASSDGCITGDALLSLSSHSISGAAFQYHESSYAFPKHLHTSAELYLITSGVCYMKIESETIQCTAGDFILILPDVIHSFYLGEESCCTFQHVHFSPELFSHVILSTQDGYSINLMHTLMFAFHTHCFQKTDAIISDCMDSILNLVSSQNSLFVSANLNVMLMKLLLHLLDSQEQFQGANFSTPQKQTAQNKNVAFAIDYIQTHYKDKIYQQDIADLLHISVRYLNKLFKQYVGITFSKYINIYRINRSIELMSGSLSLTEIALSVGYNDSQYYSKVFTQIINASPSYYRKLLNA